MRCRTATLWTWLALTVAVSTAAGQQRAGRVADGDCQVTDLMPGFWPWWRLARDSDPTRQFQLFEKRLRTPHAEVYQAVLEGLPIPVEQLIPRSIEQAKPHESTMRSLSEQLGRQLPQQLATFRWTFPDFKCSTHVYFIYSAGAFDGATRHVRGRTALLFGLDEVARVHGNNLKPLVVHDCSMSTTTI
jgi:hypothetical protein